MHLDEEGPWETTLSNKGVPVLRSTGLSSVQDATLNSARTSAPEGRAEPRIRTLNIGNSIGDLAWRMNDGSLRHISDSSGRHMLIGALRFNRH